MSSINLQKAIDLKNQKSQLKPFKGVSYLNKQHKGIGSQSKILTCSLQNSLSKITNSTIREKHKSESRDDQNSKHSSITKSSNSNYSTNPQVFYNSLNNSRIHTHNSESYTSSNSNNSILHLESQEKYHKKKVSKRGDNSSILKLKKDLEKDTNLKEVSKEYVKKIHYIKRIKNPVAKNIEADLHEDLDTVKNNNRHGCIAYDSKQIEEEKKDSVKPSEDVSNKFKRASKVNSAEKHDLVKPKIKQETVLIDNEDTIKTKLSNLNMMIAEMLSNPAILESPQLKDEFMKLYDNINLNKQKIGLNHINSQPDLYVESKPHEATYLKKMESIDEKVDKVLRENEMLKMSLKAKDTQFESLQQQLERFKKDISTIRVTANISKNTSFYNEMSLNSRALDSLSVSNQSNNSSNQLMKKVKSISRSKSKSNIKELIKPRQESQGKQNQVPIDTTTLKLKLKTNQYNAVDSALNIPSKSGIIKKALPNNQTMKRTEILDLASKLNPSKNILLRVVGSSKEVARQKNEVEVMAFTNTNTRKNSREKIEMVKSNSTVFNIPQYKASRNSQTGIQKTSTKVSNNK